MNVQIPSVIEEKITYLNYGRTNLKKAQKDLSCANFEFATDEDALLEQWHSNAGATNIIARNIKRIKTIVLKHTPITKNGSSWSSKHPWLRGSKDYDKSRILKKNARTKFMAYPNDLNKDLYQKACIFNTSIYEKARDEYLAKVLDDTKGSTNEFFTLMKSCNSTRKATPETMLFNGIYVKGTDKLNALAKQLNSCFKQDAPSMGVTPDEIRETLFDIYQLNYDRTNENLWKDFNPIISLETVKKNDRRIKG